MAISKQELEKINIKRNIIKNFEKTFSYEIMLRVITDQSRAKAKEFASFLKNLSVKKEHENYNLDFIINKIKEFESFYAYALEQETAAFNKTMELYAKSSSIADRQSYAQKAIKVSKSIIKNKENILIAFACRLEAYLHNASKVLNSEQKTEYKNKINKLIEFAQEKGKKLEELLFELEISILKTKEISVDIKENLNNIFNQANENFIEIISELEKLVSNLEEL